MKSLLPCVLCLMLAGAGCLPTVESPKTAQPLEPYTSQEVVPVKRGFGDLPNIPVPKSHATVTFAAPLPDLPTAITVLRLRSGAPGDTALLNLASSIGLPGGVLGNRQTDRELALAWTDDQRFHWTYRANERQLDFADERAQSEPLTVSDLPSDDAILQISNDFLKARGVHVETYREPLVEPDWNLWWFKAKEAKRCMDAQTLAAVRAIGASASLVAGGPPPLPETARTACVSPEFPARLTVHYHMLYDGRDALTPQGAYINGAEVVVDVSRNTVVSGRITLAADPDRSDYPALSADRVSVLLLQGGLSGTTGIVGITSYAIASLFVEDTSSALPVTYLIPSLIANGSQTRADGSLNPVRIVVPLLAR